VDWAKVIENKAEYHCMCSNRLLAFCQKTDSVSSDPSNFKVQPEKSTFHEIKTQHSKHLKGCTIVFPFSQ